MAFIGMQKTIIARLKKETPGQAIEYENGMLFGEPIGATITIQSTKTDLNAGDKTVESDNSITGGDISLDIDDIPEEAHALLGFKEVADGEGKKYVKTGDASDYIGFGFVRTRVKSGQRSYEAMWCYKVQLGLTSINGQTKGQQIQWQTPSLSGSLMAVENDASGTVNWYEFERFPTLEKALAFLQNHAGMANPS